MTQISKYPVSKNVEERMFEVFEKAIADLKAKEDIKNFFHEFLTPVEKIMLAKRLFTAVLLEKGLDYEAVKNILHVSPQTISRVNLQRQFAGEGYKKVVGKILQEESVIAFWERIEDALSHIPHSKGASIALQQKKRQEAKNASRAFKI